MRVLVVEDDEMLRDGVARGLRTAGFAVDLSSDGSEALDKATINSYDVIVLDRDLPVVHGDDVCRTLVSSSSTARIIMLTAFGEVQDRVDGLRLGADDYLPKPFAMSELIARVEALSRRPIAEKGTTLQVGDVILDPLARSVRRAGTHVDLTPKEFGVLRELLAASPAVLSAEDLIERVWDDRADPFTNAVRITMTTLRKKLGEPSPIETVIGVGYVIR